MDERNREKLVTVAPLSWVLLETRSTLSNIMEENGIKGKIKDSRGELFEPEKGAFHAPEDVDCIEGMAFEELMWVELCVAEFHSLHLWR